MPASKSIRSILQALTRIDMNASAQSQTGLFGSPALHQIVGIFFYLAWSFGMAIFGIYPQPLGFRLWSVQENLLPAIFLCLPQPRSSRFVFLQDLIFVLTGSPYRFFLFGFIQKRSNKDGYAYHIVLYLLSSHSVMPVFNICFGFNIFTNNKL